MKKLILSVMALALVAAFLGACTPQEGTEGSGGPEKIAPDADRPSNAKSPGTDE